MATDGALMYRLAHFQEGRRLKHASRCSPSAALCNGEADGCEEAAPRSTAEVGPPLPLHPHTGVDAGHQQPSPEAVVTAAKEPVKRSERLSLAAEDDEGDVEYKWRLTGISVMRFEHLVTQMKFRVTEGRGQCLYELGVADNGVLRGLPAKDYAESMDTIQRMARTLGFDCSILQECVVQREPVPLYCGELLVSRRHARGQDLSLCFCGSLGSGKSTLMGAVLYSTLDDGHGSTRQLLFNHKHEVDSGRTSSIATRVWTVNCRSASASTAAGARDGFDDAASSDADVEVSLVVDVDDVNSEDAARCSNGRGSTGSDRRDDAESHSSNETEELGSSHETNAPTDGSAEGLPSSYCSDDAASPVSAIPTTPAASSPPPQHPPGERADRRCPHHHHQRHQRHHGGFSSAIGRHEKKTSRLITLIDVGGDITKTSLFGLMSRKPDYVCLCVAADSPAESVSLYAQVSCAIGTPFLVAVTKSDAVEDFELDSLCMDLTAALHNHVGCACDVVETKEKALEYCRTWLPQHRDGAVDIGLEGRPRYVKQPPRVPVFCVSSVTGDGLELLKYTIAHLPRPSASAPMTPLSASSRQPFEVLLDNAFQVKGVGPVVRGRVSSGAIEVGCACYMGPDETGAFFPVVVRGIHVDSAHVNEAQLGDEATFAVDRVPPSVDLSHKGKVLVRQPKHVASSFRLTVRVLSQSLTPHLEPILYSRNARQAVRILECNPRSPVFGPASLTLRDAAAAREATSVKEEEFWVECEFLFRPEVLTYDASVVLRWEPKGIAVGRVSRLDSAPS